MAASRKVEIRSPRIASTHAVVKSESDKNEYRGLQLENGLKVLLVSDPTTDKSAASLSVQVGSMSDPRLVLGLAHFCEHMLFLGTKKYPKENYYRAYLSEHGGRSNACTTRDQTCYYFDVTPGNFKEAVDIFAQFFYEPLFDQDCTDREVNAVHSEYEKNIKLDARRVLRVEAVTGNPDHDFFKFTTGNRDTLCAIPKREGIDLRKALLDFHGKWYLPGLMSVCLLGKESLDELADMAIELFGRLPKKPATAPVWPEKPYTERELGVLVRIVPVKDLRRMGLTFPVPDLREHYRSNPGYYLSHLVGHEGEGSLLSHLKKKGWLTSLSGQFRSIARGFSFFTISMDLSPEGLDHTDEIATLVFQYLNMLREKGPQNSIFDELRNIGNIHFRFKSKETPINYVSALTGALHIYDWKDVLCGSNILEEYKPELISDLVNRLVPDNVRIFLVSDSFRGKTDQVEKYYSVEYAVEPIPEKTIATWKSLKSHPELRLPPPNEFIPKNFTLAPEDTKYTKAPSMLVNKPYYRLWYMQDKEYNLPKSSALFELRSPIVYQSPTNECLTHMAVVCFRDANSEYFYPAQLAGSFYDIEETTYGLLIEIHGYNERQQHILEKVCERLVDFKIDATRFQVLKERYVRQLKNFAAEQPNQQVLYYAEMALSEHFWSYDQILAVIDKNCTAERCEKFLQEILKKVYIEILVHGNMTADEARKMGETVSNILKCKTLTFEETPNMREYKLASGEIYQLDRYNEVHSTNAVLAYFQIGLLSTQELRTAALNDLFCQIIKEPCFNVLRTKEQLGYIVSARARRMHDCFGFRLMIQSERNPVYLSSRIDTFLNGYIREYIEEMQPQDFENNKKALIALKLEKPKTIYGKTSLLWREITSRAYIFDREQLESDEIAKLSKEDVLEFFLRYVAHGGPDLKQLLIHVESRVKQTEKSPGIQPTYLISNLENFKKGHGFYESRGRKQQG